MTRSLKSARTLRWKFSTRLMLLAVAIAAVPLAYVTHHQRMAARDEILIRRLRATGRCGINVRFAYRFQTKDKSASWVRRTQSSWGRLLGMRVVSMNISFSDSRDGDVAILGSFKRLKTLRVRGKMSNRSLDGLEGATRLVWLNVANTDVTDISSVSDLLRLRELNLSNTHVSELTPLARHADLVKLTMSRTLVSDLRPLAGLTQLRELNADYTLVEDITSLRRFAKLQRLNLKGTRVRDLSPLAGLPALRVIAARGSPVSNVAGLEECPQLEGLDLSHTKLAEISGLRNCPRLKWLNISEISVSRDQIDAIKSDLPLCEIWDAQ